MLLRTIVSSENDRLRDPNADQDLFRRKRASAQLGDGRVPAQVRFRELGVVADAENASGSTTMLLRAIVSSENDRLDGPPNVFRRK